jgi:polyphosphate kinase
MAVDASHPFPFLANRTLNLAILLTKGKLRSTALVQVPGVLPRIIAFPIGGKQKYYVFLEDIIKKYCGELFLGYSIKEIAPFRITRDADLPIDEETEDLLQEDK